MKIIKVVTISCGKPNDKREELLKQRNDKDKHLEMKAFIATYLNQDELSD